jgi:ferredoxin
MGHLVGKDLYRQVGRKIDSLPMRAPWNDTLRAIVEELYSPREAELFAAMPTSMATMKRIAAIAGLDEATAQDLLDGMTDKGLVLDIHVNGRSLYMPSPMVVGIFEFTMMRTGRDVDHRKLAHLFHDYLFEGGMFAANFGPGKRVSPLRTLPHGEVITDHVEILDHERAAAILEDRRRYALGICSCRHEKLHLGTRECSGPLEVCLSLDGGADFLIRHDMAREVSHEEVLDNLAQAREQGCVLSTDNVQRNVGFICHCCSCCCNILQGIRHHGYPNLIVTSSYLAGSDLEQCQGCGDCATACPIEAITMTPVEGAEDPDEQVPVVDTEICIGCGVCGLECVYGAMRLEPREQRVLHPETTFRRVILQALERGTLQNQIFGDPSRLSQRAMRGILGAFLGLPPVKRALMSDALRSRFLSAMESAVKRGGRGAVLDM